tara:strand:+ start:1120 stop:1287 length:168 start_codon:yes stop_codon:yes gene_type:complete
LENRANLDGLGQASQLRHFGGLAETVSDEKIRNQGMQQEQGNKWKQGSFPVLDST